jgi:TPR repeat protein
MTICRWESDVPQNDRVMLECDAIITAQINLGKLFKKGVDVPQDYAEALRFYKLAATRGHPMALYKVAKFYEYGYGVPIDMDEAICWYKRAQEAGFADAEIQWKRLTA